MASIANDPGGKRRVLFHGLDGKRRAIRFGKASGVAPIRTTEQKPPPFPKLPLVFLHVSDRMWVWQWSVHYSTSCGKRFARAGEPPTGLPRKPRSTKETSVDSSAARPAYRWKRLRRFASSLAFGYRLSKLTNNPVAEKADNHG